MVEQKEHWAIERRIPIALLTALAIQTGVWIWQSAVVWARLEQLEKKVEAMAPQGERLSIPGAITKALNTEPV